MANTDHYRHVAVITGRVLSIRDHAIHAPKPSTLSSDKLQDSEVVAAPVFNRLAVWPFNHMILLRQIGGRILESIYIARGADGTSLSTTFQQICTMSDEIRQDLETWKRDLDVSYFRPSREYSEMKVEYCLLQLLLNRPSPTFMIPPQQMVDTCSGAASSAIRQWTKLRSDYGMSAVCRSFRQLHAILLVGLAALHCDW